MADTSRVIIIHTPEQAKTVLEVAAGLKKPLVLQSAPDAVFYAGSLYLLNMFRKAQEAVPAAKATFILDCADTGAEAIEAIQMGHTHIRSRAPEALRSKLADIAKQHKVKLLDDNYQSLDVLRQRDIKRACQTFLTGKRS